MDTSEQSQAVFARALELAQACSATLNLFYCLVVDPITDFSIPAFSLGMTDLGRQPRLLDTGIWQQQVEERQQEAHKNLSTYHQTACDLGINAQYDCQVGEPGSQICAVAATWHADLIMMGRRGRSGLTEALLGSVSNYVLHHAPCAVLVIQ
jgi:nucleotide-binding universal stress UspA family protein